MAILVFRFTYSADVLTAGLVAVLAIISAIVRTRGRALQRTLARRWGVLPLEALLQATGEGNPLIRARRRELLAQLVGRPLPTAREECLRPEEARHRYAAATKRLQIQARRFPKEAPLVREELVNYNFARNMLAIKWVGVAVALLIAGEGVRRLLAEDDWQMPVVLSTAYSLVMVVVWLAFVREIWVRDVAKIYADRLLDALEGLVGAVDVSRPPWWSRRRR